MNRILIGSNNDKISKIKQDEIIVNITSDANILIENNSIKKYVFNVKDASLNVFSISKNKEDISYEVNIDGGVVSLNDVSYSSGNRKLNIDLNKENSEVKVYNSVVAKNKVKYDIRVNHNSKNTNSNINNNGVTKDNGTILFNVTSYAPKGSTKGKINQDSKIITLNDTNDNRINPILLIDEYECEARHAAFIGNFNNNELFYLMSRGLSESEARNLLINGLLIGTLDVCFNEKEILKKKLNEEWR